MPDGEVVQTTALIRAAQNGRLEAARLLLDAGADPSRAGVGPLEICGSPLMLAATHGHPEVLRLLLARGAAVDAARAGDGCAAFNGACWNKQPECAEALIGLGRIVALYYSSSTLYHIR
jgi:ankyrin repeat protein